MSAGSQKIQRNVNDETAITSRIHSILQRIYFKGRPSKPMSFSDSDTLLGKLGFDSLEVMQIIVAIEQEFRLTIPDTELRVEQFESVGSLIGWVMSLLKKGRRL